MPPFNITPAIMSFSNHRWRTNLTHCTLGTFQIQATAEAQPHQVGGAPMLLLETYTGSQLGMLRIIYGSE